MSEKDLLSQDGHTTLSPTTLRVRQCAYTLTRIHPDDVTPCNPQFTITSHALGDELDPLIWADLQLGARVLKSLSMTLYVFRNWARPLVETGACTAEELDGIWYCAEPLDEQSHVGQWRPAVEPATPSFEDRFKLGQVDIGEALELLGCDPANQHYSPVQIEAMGASLRCLQELVHEFNRAAGWWSDLETGEPKERNDGEMLMLMVTELAEAMEGVRKNLMDDKVGNHKMVTVELADTIIRILDFAGGRGLPLAEALLMKLAFNRVRVDHTRAARQAANGKKC